MVSVIRSSYRNALSVLLVVTLGSIAVGQEGKSDPSAKTFIDNTSGIPPRENLTQALKIFSAEIDSAFKQRRLVAADLGAGAGNETIYLARHGWDVVAIDVNPYAVQTIQKRADALHESAESSTYGTVHVRQTTMQQMSLDNESFDLINASLSLPFVPQGEIKEVWKVVVQALKPGGIFTGHFFGPEHEWSNDTRKSFFSVKQLFEELFQDSPLEIRLLTNDKETIRLGAGGTAFFHTITVIAQKIPKK